MAEINSGTAEGMTAFLTWLGSKGLMNPKTAEAYRSASKKVLEVEDAWENLEVADIDTDAYLNRFARLHGSRYTPESLSTYGTRFRTSVELYLDYLRDPTGFRAVLPRRRRRPTGLSPSRAPRDRDEDGAQSRPADSGLITYPFPLSSGSLAYLQLPRELTSADSRRLASFIDSLTLDSQGALQPGRVRED